MSDYVNKTYTVDDEEPKCGRCNHFGDDFDCCEHCGAEHGWNGYERTELVTTN